MMKLTTKSWIVSLTLAIFVFAASLHAQSFYSQRGIGLPNFFVSGQAAGMGGVGIAVSDRLTINYLNPAALVELPAAFISGNFTHSATSLDIAGQDAALSNTNVSGVSFLVPLKQNRFVMGLSVLPFSEIEYSFTGAGIVSGETYQEILEGDGGINTALLSASFRPFNRLSIGISGVYYFGGLRRLWTVAFDDPTSGLANTRQEVRQQTSAGGVRLGAQFELTPGWRVGGVFSPSASFNANQSVTLVNIQDFEDLPDTQIEIPMSYGIGTSFFLGRKLLVGADYHVQQWRDTNTDGYIDNGQRIAFGMEYSGRGGTRINSSFWSRSAVRIGFYYADLGLRQPAGENVSEVFGTLGLGIPVKWSAARLDLALEFGKRGSLDYNPVAERIIRFSATATVGERWFYRTGQR